MRIESDTGGWHDAASAFLAGNQRAALTATTLTQALSASAGIAGDDSTSIDFATAYDQAAQTAADSLADLVDAYANLARLTDHSRANHTRADQASRLGTTLGCTTYDGTITPGAGECVSITRVALRSALGGEPISLPHPVSWVLDHIQGFLWPNADTDQLRATATDWAHAAIHLSQLRDVTSTARHHLQGQTSPEIPHAVAATNALQQTTGVLAGQVRDIGHTCTTYADQVDQHRHAIITLVEDLLRDAVIVESIGIVLGVVTAGLTAAGAAALNAAHIAVEAPRILGLLKELEALATAGAELLNVARFTIAPLGTTLVRLKTARVIAAAVTLTNGMPGPLNPDDPASQGGAKPLIDLQEQEKLGGHTIERHVGWTADQLAGRLHARPGLDAASTFPDEDTAQRAVESALHLRQEQIAGWLDGKDDVGRFRTDVGQQVGQTRYQDGTTVETSGVRIVLVRDSSAPGGYYVKTAFPDPEAQQLGAN